MCTGQEGRIPRRMLSSGSSGENLIQHLVSNYYNYEEMVRTKIWSVSYTQIPFFPIPGIDLCSTLAALGKLCLVCVQTSFLHNFTNRCSSMSRLLSIGKSVEGRELWALELSDKPGVEEPEPSFKYVANMHGDEPSGR